MATRGRLEPRCTQAMAGVLAVQKKQDDEATGYTRYLDQRGMRQDDDRGCHGKQDTLSGLLRSLSLWSPEVNFAIVRPQKWARGGRGSEIIMIVRPIGRTEASGRSCQMLHGGRRAQKRI